MSGTVNRLRGTRAYLCGAMDRISSELATGWRNDITYFLEEKNVVIIDPCNKPITHDLERPEYLALRKKWKKEGNWEEFHKYRAIRNMDLRSVDICDFLVVNFNLDHKPVGTIEEIVTANRQKKPIILFTPGGRHEAPDWLLWMIGHETIFSSLGEAKNYLQSVDFGNIESERWIIFDKLN